MAVMFVHGVPATSRLWRDVIRLVDRQDEVVAVDLPGMAAPAPAGWRGTKEDHVAWLIGEIEALTARSGGPIHLVGHDWGCLLALRAASLRPELLRSVAAGNGPIDPHWPLHAFWDLWNQPGIGEDVLANVLGPRAVELLTPLGFPPEDAAICSFATDHGQKAILKLYRSAIHVGTEWAEDLPRIIIPSMLIWGVRDLIVPVEIGRRMATRIGAEVVQLDSDHFWPYRQPEAAARALLRHWDRAESLSNTILTQSLGNNEAAAGPL